MVLAYIPDLCRVVSAGFRLVGVEKPHEISNMPSNNYPSSAISTIESHVTWKCIETLMHCSVIASTRQTQKFDVSVQRRFGIGSSEDNSRSLLREHHTRSLSNLIRDWRHVGPARIKWRTTRMTWNWRLGCMSMIKRTPWQIEYRELRMSIDQLSITIHTGARTVLNYLHHRWVWRYLDLCSRIFQYSSRYCITNLTREVSTNVRKARHC